MDGKKRYSRPVVQGPEKIINDGKPVFGTFDTIPRKLDIKGVTAPFGGIPLPPALSRLRIRARAIYTFNINGFFGTVDFFDNKILNMAEFALWNIRTGQKFVYRQFLGARKRLIPTHLNEGQCVSPGKRRHFRLAWHHNDNRLSFKADVLGGKYRPKVNASLQAMLNGEETKEILSVKPAPTMRRCSATWYAAGPVKGSLELNGKSASEKIEGEGQGFLFVNRAFYKFISRGENITACGMLRDKKIQLRISTTNLDAVDTNKYNDNVLFVNGELTTLPQVYLTHPFGVKETWTVQDVQGMVDLEFTPVTSYERRMNLVLVKNHSDTVFGYLNGALWDKEGNKIFVKDLAAVARRNMLRI